MPSPGRWVVIERAGGPDSKQSEDWSTVVAAMTSFRPCTDGPVSLAHLIPNSPILEMRKKGWQSGHLLEIRPSSPQKVCCGFSQSQIQFSMEGLGQGLAPLLTPFNDHKTPVNSVFIAGFDTQVCPPDHVRVAVHPGTFQSPDPFSQARPIGHWP